MSSDKSLNELRKATLASYLSKAGSRVRTGTKLGQDFEAEKYKHMAIANKHHPLMVTPGFEKDPEKLADAERNMKANADLEKTFKRDAANRIKGIARAGRLLAKEETLDEVTHQISVNHKHVDSFKKDLDDAGIPHKPGKKSLVGNYATVAVHAKHVDKAFKIAGNRVPKEFREEAEQIDELKLNTAVRALRSMKSTADDYYASQEDQRRVTRFRNAIKRKWGEKGAEVADKVSSDSHTRQKAYDSGDMLKKRAVGADDVITRGKRKGKLRPEVQGAVKATTNLNLMKLKKQPKPNLPEEVEQIDELKKSTVASYLSKAVNRHTANMTQAGALHGAAAVVAPGETLSKDELEDHLGKKAVRQMETRPKGMNRALKQLAKESALTGGREAGRFPVSRVGHSYDSLTVRRGVNFGTNPNFVSKKMNKTYEKKEQERLKAAIKKSLAKEEVDQIDEVSRSTIAKVAQARYNQAQKALKDKNYHEYVQKMKKAIKAGDATTPKTGWSHEEETQLPAAEPIVEVSAQEKYRQIREAKMRNRKGK